MKFSLQKYLLGCVPDSSGPKPPDIEDATGYHHLGVGFNESSACEISQAHPADLPNKFLTKSLSYQKLQKKCIGKLIKLNSKFLYN